MQKSCIYLLLILLVWKQINCQETCPFGKILEDGVCKKCETPKFISSDNLRCTDTCEDNEFIKKQSSENFELCVKECPEDFDPDNKYCKDFECLLKDFTKKRIACLNNFKDCTNGVISIDGSRCQMNCSSDEITIDYPHYRQCGICDFHTHAKYKINNILTCKKMCEENEIYDLNFKCILRSECKGFVDLDSYLCEKECTKVIQQIDNQYKTCSIECSLFQYKIYNQKYCLKECPENTIIYTDKRICYKQVYQCLGFIFKQDKQLYCVDECELGQFFKTEIGYSECLQECNDFQYQQKPDQITRCSKQCKSNEITDTKKSRCYDSEKQCEFGFSPHSKHCVEKCEAQEFIQYQSGNRLFFCLSSCPDYQYEFNGKKYCAKECPQNMVIDELSSNKMCHANISGCQVTVSLDEKKCQNSCNADNREFINSKKCDVCQKFYFADEQSCKKTCSSGLIIDKLRKLCYKNEKECPDVISSDGTECLSKCDSHNRETIVKIDNYSQCQVCYDYFTERKNKSNNSCSQKCDSHLIAIIPSKTCTSDQSDCQNYLISADRKSCDIQCQSGEIIKQGICIFMDECSGGNEIIDETTDQVACISKENKTQSCELESADGKRCVNSCLSPKQVEKQQPTNSFSKRKCEDCIHPEKSFITLQNNVVVRVCKQSILAIEFKDAVMHLLKTVKTMQDFQRIKEDLNNFIEDYQMNDPKEVSGVLQTFNELAKEFFSTLLNDSLSSVKYTVHSVGSSNKVLVCFQLIDKGKSILNSFNIQSILRESTLDLTEIRDSNTIPDQNGIMLLIFKNNDLCKKDSCKNFPVVYANHIDLKQERKLSDQGLFLRAIFPMKQPLAEYLCSHYNDDLTEFKAFSKPQRNKIALSCPLDGPTSIEIVENSQYYESEQFGFQGNNSNSINGNRRKRRASVLILIIILVVIA